MSLGLFSCYSDGFLQFGCQKLLIGKLGVILSNFYRTVFIQHEIFNVLSISFRTQNKTYRRLFPWFLLVLIELPEIKQHLSFIFWFEFTQFQIDGNQASQFPMEEQQIDVIIYSIYSNTLLACYECKIGA